MVPPRPPPAQTETVRLDYTEGFWDGLKRVTAFLADKNPAAAAHVAWRLRQAPKALLSQPRQGQRLMVYQPREVRRLLIGPYEIRYEIERSHIHVLGVWHTREQRP